MNQAFNKHRVRFSYNLDNQKCKGYYGGTVSAKIDHVTVLVRDDDCRPDIEILAEHLGVDPQRLSLLGDTQHERTLGYYTRYVRVECKRKFDASGAIVSQKIQHTRKPFDIIHTEYDISYYNGTSTHNNFIRIDTDTYIYDVTRQKDELRIIEDKNGEVTVYGYIHIPEDATVKATVNAALENVFEDYAKQLEARVRVIRENNTVWSNIKA